MRRKDREVVNIDDILNIIEKCDVCRIALSGDEYPYIVPMNFGYEYKDSKLFIYLHCANEGKKLDLIKKNNRVCFEMDCSHKLVKGKTPYECTMEYESVIGIGTIEIMKDNKQHALTLLMKHYSDEETFTFTEKMLLPTTVLKITADEITGKSLKK